MIIHGNSYEVLDTLETDSIDTCITDPPYGLRFMGKKWDYDIPRKDFWSKVYRVLKPGAFMLVFGGTRTFHRLAVEIEDSGFEIRDCIMWLYGQGFPKSYDISKGIDKKLGKEREILEKSSNSRPNSERGNGLAHGIYGKEFDITKPASEQAQLWDGWGTALKPAWEPILVCMKPTEGTFAENALIYDVAGLNIDGARIGTDEITTWTAKNGSTSKFGQIQVVNENKAATKDHNGRFPANLILDEESAQMVDDQSGDRPSGKSNNNAVIGEQSNNIPLRRGKLIPRYDSGGASRFFYVAKASKKERGKDNNHPTVKPIALLEYLCTLTSTPNGGIVLDPFMGSGSMGIAAYNTGREYIGIEIEEEYYKIAQRRIYDENTLHTISRDDTER